MASNELSLFEFKNVESFTTPELQGMAKKLKNTSSRAKSWVMRRAARDDLERVNKELEARAKSQRATAQLLQKSGEKK